MDPSQAVATPINKTREDRIKELRALLAKEPDAKIDTPMIPIPQDVIDIIEVMQGKIIQESFPAAKTFRAWKPKNSTDIIVSAGGRFDTKKLVSLEGYIVTYKIGFNISKAK